MTTTLDSRPIAVDRLPAPPIADPNRQPANPVDSPDRRWLGVLMGVVIAGLSGWAFTRGISTPWPWSDEGATYLALHRSIPQLFVLYQGPDAPLVPYYLLAKAWTGALQSFWPLTPTLTAVRLLSAAAGALTVVVLYALVARNAGRLAGLLSGLLLVSLPGFDRLAQEGRAYTLLALAATSSWLMWDRWLRPGTKPSLWGVRPEQPAPGAPPGLRAVPAGVAYLASLAALGMIHTFGLFQWPAQLLATLTTRAGRSWRRLSALGLTAAVLVLAGLLIAGQTLASITHGTGSESPNAARVVNLATATTQVVRGAFLSTRPVVIAVVLTLAIVGVIGTRRTRPFALAMFLWLLVPLGLELVLAALKTNLFRSRYWVADLPPLAALAGLGLTVIAAAVNNLLTAMFRTGPGARRPVATAVRVLMVAALLTGILALQATLQAHEQNHLRSLRGHHGEDLAGVLRVVDQTRAGYPHLEVVISSGAASGILGAARPALQAQNPLRQFDSSVPTVFTVPATQASVRAAIRHSRQVLWIFRGALDAHSAAARIPHGLAGLHMHVRWAASAGHTWTAILLQPGVSVTTANASAGR